MPFVKIKDFNDLVDCKIIYHKLKGEFERHDAFVKKYEGTWQSMNRDSNFGDLLSKRDLLQVILTNNKKGD